MIEYIDRSFYSHEGEGASASIEIRQFDTQRAADREYHRKVDVHFQTRDEWSTDWFVPDELSFESQAADQYQYGCQLAGYFQRLQCQYVAQYATYVLHFNVSINDTNVLTYPDLLDVLQAIDERFVFALNEQ